MKITTLLLAIVMLLLSATAEACVRDPVTGTVYCDCTYSPVTGTRCK